MIRGTTPTLSFKLPFSVDSVSAMWVTISQNGIPVITKTLSDVIVDEADDKKISYKMTQFETLRLSAQYPAQIQIRAKLIENNDAVASEIVDIPVSSILKDGII